MRNDMPIFEWIPGMLIIYYIDQEQEGGLNFQLECDTNYNKSVV